MRIDEVAEDVNVRAVHHGGDLDAGDELDLCLMTGGGGRRGCGGRVVIGDAQDVDAGGGGAADELGGRATAVGGGCVCVEIDQRRAFAFGPLFLPARSRSALYSLIS